MQPQRADWSPRKCPSSHISTIGGEKSRPINPHAQRHFRKAIIAAIGTEGRQKMAFKNRCAPMASKLVISCRALSITVLGTSIGSTPHRSPLSLRSTTSTQYLPARCAIAAAGLPDCSAFEPLVWK